MDSTVPVVGLGTMGLKESCTDAISTALNAGCSLVDTGEHYDNLNLVGAALKESSKRPFLVLKLSGMPSEEYDKVSARTRAMLAQLGVASADLCLMHWPGLCKWDPTDSSPLANPSDFQPKASTWREFCENIAPAWANMLKLKEEGLIKEVGTSNFYQHHLEELSRQCSASPYANEIFIDAANQETEFVDQMHKEGIRVLAYRPVIYKPFPQAIAQVSDRLSTSPQSVVLAWLLRRGVFPLVKCRGTHIKENFTTATELSTKLSDADLQLIRSADVGLKHSAEWFAKVWKYQNISGNSGISEEDVQILTGMGVEEARARECLSKCGGNLDAAMDAAFS
jgi:diketogulonate reductase-like aldo/keto reductase